MRFESFHAIWGLEMKLKQAKLLAVLLVAVSYSPATAADAICEDKTLVVLGDSLVAGNGLGPNEGFPEQFASALRKEGYGIKVINAGVSGDTSTGGLARIDWSVPNETDAVIIELGANDALRGIAPEITTANLDAIVGKFQARKIEVLIAGMMAPPNMGKVYGDAFNGLYPQIAGQRDVLLYPFFLDGVAGNPALNQADGIHPTAEGVALIIKNFLPLGLELVQRICED